MSLAYSALLPFSLPKDKNHSWIRLGGCGLLTPALERFSICVVQ